VGRRDTLIVIDTHIVSVSHIHTYIPTNTHELTTQSYTHTHTHTHTHTQIERKRRAIPLQRLQIEIKNCILVSRFVLRLRIFSDALLLIEEIRLKIFGYQDFTIPHYNQGTPVYTHENLLEILVTPVKTCFNGTGTPVKSC